MGYVVICNCADVVKDEYAVEVVVVAEEGATAAVGLMPLMPMMMN